MNASVRFVFMLIGIFQLTNINAAMLKVPHNFSTIQSGIDAASDGDSVVVADGTYTSADPSKNNEVINFKGKKILVTSENGAKFCKLLEAPLS
jgi:hypothetical protein